MIMNHDAASGRVALRYLLAAFHVEAPVPLESSAPSARDPPSVANLDEYIIPDTLHPI
jgi:hypothetical protein